MLPSEATYSILVSKRSLVTYISDNVLLKVFNRLLFERALEGIQTTRVMKGRRTADTTMKHRVWTWERTKPWYGPSPRCREHPGTCSCRTWTDLHLWSLSHNYKPWGRKTRKSVRRSSNGRRQGWSGLGSVRGHWKVCESLWLLQLVQLWVNSGLGID